MWTLGTLIAFPLCTLLAVALVVFGVWLWRSYRGSYNAESAWLGVGLTVCGVILAVLIASPAGMWPYKADYHRYTTKSGVVSDVNKRIVGGSSDLQQKFVVRFAGSRQEYGCEDTRCAVIHRGNRVALSCKRQWQYAGTDGWNCAFVSNEGAAS